MNNLPEQSIREMVTVLRDEIQCTFPQATLVAMLEYKGLSPNMVPDLITHGIIHPRYEEKKPPEYTLHDLQRAYTALSIRDAGGFRLWSDVRPFMVNTFGRPEWNEFFTDEVMSLYIIDLWNFVVGPQDVQW